MMVMVVFFIALRWIHLSTPFFFSSRRRHTIFDCDWSSDVCSSDLPVHRRRNDAARGTHSWLHEAEPWERSRGHAPGAGGRSQARAQGHQNSSSDRTLPGERQGKGLSTYGSGTAPRAGGSLSLRVRGKRQSKTDR